MNILLLGLGGREHAMAQKIAESPHCSQLYTAPGNPGTAQLGINIPVSATDFEALAEFSLKNEVGMIVVGPEIPLVEGVYDYFSGREDLRHIAVIGPSKMGAQLEGSKSFCKSFLIRHGIPTAAYKEITPTNIEEGFYFLENLSAPYVLKADGLAAGKGVLICKTLDEAKQELQEMLSGKFGNASTKVVIEEFMQGIEFSVFVLSDGMNYKILPVAKDYKRVGEGDTGLNTGGMGAVSPPPFVTEKIMDDVERTIIIPTIEGLKKDQIVYKGFIYVGLMLMAGDVAKVVEYNCRMGDPESEAVFPRIKSDIVELFKKTAEGKLDSAQIEIDDRAAVTVILCSGGYPEDFEKGKLITGIEEVKDSMVFHAGTKLENERLVTNGGRVLAVTSLHADWEKAVKISNANAEKIQFDGKYYRRDIGFDL